MRAPPHDARALPWSRTQDREIDDMTSSAPLSPQRREQQGMTWIPGGSFLMGSQDFHPEERPVRGVELDGFWIDERLVTVADFRRFVKATGMSPSRSARSIPRTTPAPSPTRS